MFKIFKLLKNEKENESVPEFENIKKQSEIEDESAATITSKQVVTFEEMFMYLQDKILSIDEVATEDEKQNLLSDAMSGDIESKEKVKSYLKDYILQSNMDVEGWTIDDLVDEVYAYGWGLGPVEKYNSDKNIDEIRVNRPDSVFVVEKGVPRKVPETFKDEDEVATIIKRMIIEDVGVSLDKSSPTVESVRKDGSRLTATCSPVTKTWTFILRKHTSFVPTIENYINRKTFDMKTWKRMSTLVKGRASILISGNVGAGKTTLMKMLIGEHSPKLRICVIGKDLEARLFELYPDRDILELEEHPHVGASMRNLFNTLLRESPDIIVVEEFRGSGEAIEAIRACSRGLSGSMATAHFNNAMEAIEGTGLFMLEEGLNLTLELAKLRVARAFNIVIQMIGDSITGSKKVVAITEVVVDNEGRISYNELVKWMPSIEDRYFGDGTWEIVGKPSQHMINHLLKNVAASELRELGWL